MTKRLFAFFAVFLFAVTMTVTAADARISMSAEMKSSFEGTDTGSSSFGFGEPAANIDLYGEVASNVDAHVEILVLPAVSGFAGQGTEVDEAYITLNEMAGPADVKLGRFEVDFGNRHLTRSDNAQVQENPLIGNEIYLPFASQSGVEFSDEFAGGNMGWALAVTNGNTTINFAEDGGFALAPKFWGNFGPGLKAALSYYAVDHSGSPIVDNLASELDVIQVAASPYQNLAAVPQASLSNVGGAGSDVSAFQLDFGWEGQMVEVNTWWLSVEDDAPTPAAEMASYGLEGVFNFTPNAHGAARYSVVTDESSGAPAGDQSDRLQVGVGYELNENTLAKLEWMDQTNENPTTGAGVGADADGFVGELSVSF